MEPLVFWFLFSGLSYILDLRSSMKILKILKTKFPEFQQETDA